jgi:multiple sugar transport system permease protein
MKATGWALAGRGFVYVLLLLGAALTLTPVVWLVAATLKGPDDLFHYLFFAPLNRWTLASFADLFHKVDFFRYLMNSIFVSSTIVVTQLFFVSLAGFPSTNSRVRRRSWY